MRQLTSKQKKVLDKYVESQKETSDFPFANLLDWDNLPSEIIAELEKINDTEILYQEVNRYLSDKSTEILHKKR